MVWLVAGLDTLHKEMKDCANLALLLVLLLAYGLMIALVGVVYALRGVIWAWERVRVKFTRTG